ncbi:MAG: discoidin domain-containing protein [Verrucomicrobiaceae bacterium]|nr:discoidin domain-containing protein [Verrucomicrobiaceae bacterium]
MIFHILVCAVAVTASVFSEEKQNVSDGLQDLKGLYNKKVKESIQSLQTNFIKNLDDLEKRLAAQRKLEMALVVREERVRISIDPLSESDRDVVSQSPELKRLMEIYERHRESRIRPVRLIYLTALKRLESKLIGERELTEALKIRKEIKGVEAENNIEPRAQFSGERPQGDVALIKKGAKASCEETPELMIDGLVDNVNQYGKGKIPATFTITLDQVYALSDIRLRLYDFDTRHYTYKLETSVTGKRWELLADHSRKPSRGLVKHRFPTKDVKYIRIHGLGNNTNDYFHIIEVIAR